MKKIQLTVFLIFTVTLIQAQIIKEADERYINVIVLASSKGKIYDNTEVSFIINEAVKFGDINIPKHTNFYAVAKFKDGRVYFSVNKLKIEDKIYDVNLNIVDKDFIEGLVINRKYKYFVLDGSEQFLFKINNVLPKAN